MTTVGYRGCLAKFVGRVLSAVLLSSLILHAVPVNAAITASSFAPKVDFATDSGPIGVAIGDIDGDNQPDLAVSNLDPSVSVLRNTSTTGSVSFDPKVDLNTATGPYGVAIADIDGDGKSDLAVTIHGDGTGTTVSVFRNTSTTGSVSFEAGVSFPTGNGPLGIAAGDIDGDGDRKSVV